MRTTWRTLIQDEMEVHNESFAEVVSSTLTDEQLDVAFDCGYGGPEGIPFTLWTQNRVYFPVCYDGAERVDSVPRNPNNEPSGHFGGW